MTFDRSPQKHTADRRSLKVKVADILYLDTLVMILVALLCFKTGHQRKIFNNADRWLLRINGFCLIVCSFTAIFVRVLLSPPGNLALLLTILPVVLVTLNVWDIIRWQHLTKEQLQRRIAIARQYQGNQHPDIGPNNS